MRRLKLRHKSGRHEFNPTSEYVSVTEHLAKSKAELVFFVIPSETFDFCDIESPSRFHPRSNGGSPNLWHKRLNPRGA